MAMPWRTSMRSESPAARDVAARLLDQLGAVLDGDHPRARTRGAGEDDRAVPDVRAELHDVRGLRHLRDDREEARHLRVADRVPAVGGAGLHGGEQRIATRRRARPPRTASARTALAWSASRYVACSVRRMASAALFMDGLSGGSDHSGTPCFCCRRRIDARALMKCVSLHAGALGAGRRRSPRRRPRAPSTPSSSRATSSSRRASRARTARPGTGRRRDRRALGSPSRA